MQLTGSDEIQDVIAELNELGYDEICIRATNLQATCYLFKEYEPVDSPAAVQYTSGPVMLAIRGALEAAKISCKNS